MQSLPDQQGKKDSHYHTAKSAGMLAPVKYEKRFHGVKILAYGSVRTLEYWVKKSE